MEDEIRALRAAVESAPPPDDDTPLGAYTWGRNIDGRMSGRWQVVERINDAPELSVWASYAVRLEVPSEWQARAIAAILNQK